MFHGIEMAAHASCQRWGAVRIGALVMLMLCVLLTGCKSQLYADMDERDANEMVAVLGVASIEAEKKPSEGGRFVVSVASGDFERAFQVLRERGLPRSQFSNLGEVFKREGLVTSANAERLRLMYAMSQELSQTLSQIDGVLLARVHPVLPAGDAFGDQRALASASVFIKHTASANVQLLAPAIRDMVSSSIEGLSYDRVSLTFVPASADAMPPPPGAGAGGAAEVVAPSSRLAWLAVPAAVGSLLLAGGALLLLLRRQHRGAERATDQPDVWPTIIMDDLPAPGDEYLDTAQGTKATQGGRLAALQAQVMRWWNTRLASAGGRQAVGRWRADKAGAP